MSNKKHIFLIFFVFFGLAAPISFGTKYSLSAASSLSISIGLPHNGALKHGEVLPSKGSGYQLLNTAKERKARFGVTELVMLVKHATFKVHQKHKGKPLAIGDLSKRTGGRFDHHASHQNGRDVDFGFYALDNNGHPVALNGLVPFDKNGFSIKPAMKYKFDLKRNWALVRQLIESPYAGVQWIFIADHLEQLLLDYAAETGVSPTLVRKAEQIMKQPSKSAHWDHYHVRIYCPANDKPECKDFGPKWAWTR
ncbi:MAG: penicillin-insensitive murein endopeptidase [Deltaproteobacteria bacterium]|nr:penicillin-insensitive murein endopeptidase [Deltaproteobacteria bacterium]